MAGWIKIEKDLITDPRFRRMVKQSATGLADVTLQRYSETHRATLLLGAITTLWIYADTHIREDDCLALGIDEIDELVGVQGFADLMPPDWLEVIDSECVKLPGFQQHNGLEAKKKAQTQKRVQRFRKGQNEANVTHERYSEKKGAKSRNASELPDQTIPDHTKPERLDTHKSAVRVSFEPLREAYPDCRNRVSWIHAYHFIQNHLDRGVGFEELLAGVQRYAAYCQATGKCGTQFVLTPQKFFSEPDDPWAQPWEPPKSKAEVAQDANISAAQAWLEGA